MNIDLIPPQTMILADEDIDNDDPFSNKLFSFQQDGPGGVDLFNPVIVGRKTLLAMEPGDVTVFKWDKPLSYQGSDSIAIFLA